MNDFYKQPKFLQWLEAILLLVIGFYPAILIIEQTYERPIFGILFLFYIPIGQFTTAPFFKLTGIYTYYSPMLLGYMANNVNIDLHSGTSFDYLFVMRKYKSGVESRNRLLKFHLEGLIQIISQIENNIIPKTVHISGTSYFFNDRTLTKLGFEQKVPSFFYRLNLFVNLVDLIWMYSFSKGRLSMPKIWHAKMASISGERLVENKAIIEALYQRLVSKLSR